MEEKLKKNNCQTILRYDENQNPIFKFKQKFKTHKLAIEAAKAQNQNPSQIKKIISYKCTVCYEYHIGRSKKDLKSKYLNKIKKESFQIKKDKKIRTMVVPPVTNFKVVGKIDLSKFKIKKNE